MNKNRKYGFTLIELLAVIVILAIIALIATPIVLNIINDSKESATLRSADFYLDAVEFSIAQRVLESKSITDGTYNIIESGNVCLGKLENNTCSDEMVVEVNGDTPESGTITIESGQISDIFLTYGDKNIVKDEKGNLVFAPGEEPEVEKTLATICTYDSTNGVAEKTAGAKYRCEVKEGTSYNFYVLTTPEEGAETINLIMDRNIYYDAEADTSSETTETNKGLVAWYAASNNNSYGPVTAMDYLYNATKDWTNIPDMIMNYTDEGNKYGTIITTEGVTKITKKDGTAVTVLTDKEGYTNLKARMPYYSEVSDYNEESNNAYLYDNLSLVCYDNDEDYNEVSCEVAGYIEGVQAEGITHIAGIGGYWTLSSFASPPPFAWYVFYDGYLVDHLVAIGSGLGVRPVINLKI